MVKKFKCVVGLSDHTEVIDIAIGATAMGANIIEKHIKLDNDSSSVDAKFAIDTKELKKLVQGCRNVFEAKGKVYYGPTKNEIPSLKSIRTLFFNKDLKKDHVVTKKDINRSRPGLGLKIKYLNKILGKKIKNDIKIGTPVKFNLLKN